MKDKVIMDVMEDETEVDLSALYDQYTMCTKIEREAKKQKEQIKKQIAEFFKDGEEDGFGNVRLFTAKGAFKKEVRKTVTLDPIMADPILKRLMLYDKVVTFEPVYDMDVIKEYFADGTISSDLMEKMFKTEVSYAIRTEEAKTQEEEA